MPDPTPSKSQDIGRCERCGKLVVFTKYTLCYECRQNEKVDVERALAYLKTHPGSTLGDVSTHTGVDPQLVLRLIRGGRIDTLSKKSSHRKNHS